MAQVVLQVAASTDDADRRLIEASFSLVQANCRAGFYNAGTYQFGGGMRFTNVTIPQGATISSAFLTLRCQTAQSNLNCRTRISAEDVDDAITFADDAAAFDTRYAARTTARVDWDNIAAWTLDTDYNSPEIKTVIQEIVDRAGWVSGNDIVIFWEDYDNRSGAETVNIRYAYSYDGSAANAPKLTIDYTAAATGAVMKANNPKFSSMDRLLPRP